MARIESRFFLVLFVSNGLGEIFTIELLLAGMVLCTGFSWIESTTGSVCTPPSATFLQDTGVVGGGGCIGVGVQLSGVFAGGDTCCFVEDDTEGVATEIFGFFRGGDGVTALADVVSESLTSVFSSLSSNSFAIILTDLFGELVMELERRFLASFFSNAVSRLRSIMFSIGSHVLYFVE